MPQIGPLEIAVVLLIALLVFGPNRLPEMARQVGGALRELRRIQSGLRDDIHGMMADESDGAAPPPTLPPKADADDAPTGESRSGDAAPGDTAPGDTAPGETATPGSSAARPPFGLPSLPSSPPDPD